MAGRKPVTQCTDTEWRKIVARLRAVAPAPEGYRFVFRRSKTCDGWGDCDHNEKTKTFTIRVAHGLSEDHTADTAIHETAHAYDWRPGHANYSDHGPTWGCYYARIYAAYHGERH